MNGGDDILMDNTEKAEVLNVFFTSVFLRTVHFQASVHSSMA